MDNPPSHPKNQPHLKLNHKVTHNVEWLFPFWKQPLFDQIPHFANGKIRGGSKKPNNSVSFLALQD